MNYIYFPSCNFTKASPEAARRLRTYLSEHMPTAGCCRVDRLDYPAGSTALYFCQACRETLETRTADLVPQNLFVYLMEDSEFPWPDYSGLTVTVQDCWRDRKHPEIFSAVRGALCKMGVAVREMEESRERSVFCGNLHFEPRLPENLALMRELGEPPLFQAPEEVQRKLMREQVEKLPCPLAVTACNRCKAGLTLGGAAAVHLVELAMGTWE